MKREADGPITHSLILNEKMYIFTKTSTYRVRLKKRNRDKNKDHLADIALLIPCITQRLYNVT